MRILPATAALAATLFHALPARAEPHCMARALADVPAMEAPEEVRSKKSGPFGPITQIKINRRTGRMFYCAQNTYCYDSNAFEIVTPCRIKHDKGYGFGFSSNFAYFTR